MSRSRPPSFDFFPEDFLAGTMHLHPTCIGIYIRLLCFQWSHGAVPLDDQRQLMQITGAMPDELAEHLPQVRDKFECIEGDGLYCNARLEREREKKERISSSRTEAANHRWASRPKARSKPSDKRDGDANAYANACANQNAKPMHPIGSGKKEEGSNQTEKRSASSPAGEWNIPERLDTPEIRELLAEFEDMRAKKRAPIKDRKASSRVLKHFDDIEHLAYAIEFCIANGYQGLKPDYRKPASPSAARPVQKTFAQMQVDNTIQAGEEWLAHG